MLNDNGSGGKECAYLLHIRFALCAMPGLSLCISTALAIVLGGIRSAARARRGRSDGERYVVGHWRHHQPRVNVKALSTAARKISESGGGERTEDYAHLIRKKDFQNRTKPDSTRLAVSKFTPPKSVDTIKRCVLQLSILAHLLLSRV